MSKFKVVRVVKPVFGEVGRGRADSNIRKGIPSQKNVQGRKLEVIGWVSETRRVSR